MPAAASASSTPTALPRLVVFDLDACLWSPEMYQLGEPPSAWCDIRGGVVAGRSLVRLFPGALHAFEQLATNAAFAGTRVALASSTSEPGYARATLALYRLPATGGVLADMVAHAELYPIPVKTAHFKRIQLASGLPYSDMLFFDDCNCARGGEAAALCQHGRLRLERQGATTWAR